MPWSAANLVGAGDTGGYLDPSNLATLFQDSAATTGVTGDSQPVGTFRGTTSGGTAIHDATQGTSTAKPTYRTDGTKHWLQFDGGDWLDFGVGRFGRAGLHADVSEAWTVAIACDTGNGTYLARCGTGAQSTRTFQFISYPGANQPCLTLRGMNSAGNPQPIDSGGNSGLAPQVLIARWDGSACTIRSRDYVSTLAVGSAAEETTQRIILGARNNGSTSFLPNNSKVYQLFLVDRAISDTEMAYLAYHFGQKVGLTLGTQPPDDPAISGTISVQETGDTVSASGQVTSSGILSASETGDVSSVAGVITASGLLTANEAGDTGNAAGAISSTGSLNATESPDTPSIGGAVANGLAGALAATDSADTTTATGSVSAEGAMTAAEVGDAAAIAGIVLVPVAGSASATESADAFSAAGAISTNGTITALEASDTSAAAGVVLSPVTGVVAATESADETVSTGTVGIEPEHQRLLPSGGAFIPRYERDTFREASAEARRLDSPEFERLAG